ncbi:MAG: DUF1629 domain-containing protein [Rhodoglobus sp.]
MRRYFRLCDQVDAVPKRWHLDWARLADGTEPSLSRGIFFDSRERPVIPVTHAGLVLDFCLTSFAVPVATEALADAVSTVAGADVQCVPVEISGQQGMVVLNSLRVVRCIDEQHSEFIKWTAQDHRADLAGQYRSITRLVLDARAIPADARFFRLDGSFVELVVTEDVKDAMERVGCFGAKFIELAVTSGYSG